MDKRVDDQVLSDLDRCRDRIAALSALVDGWHDGTGHVPTVEAIATGQALLTRNPAMAGLYRIFPTESGGLLFEFTRAGWDYSVEIAPNGQAEIYGIEENGEGEMDTGHLDFESQEFRSQFEHVTGGHQ